MYERCPNCKLKYERGPGYFLGSAYLNYGLTAVIITVSYITLRFGARSSQPVSAVGLGRVLRDLSPVFLPLRPRLVAGDGLPFRHRRLRSRNTIELDSCERHGSSRRFLDGTGG